MGKQLGYSASWVSRVEADQLRPDDAVLSRLCGVLGLTAADVGCEGEDVLHRRTMLGLGVGAGLGAVLPSPAAAAGADRKELVERSLFRLPDARPAARESLAAALTQARAFFQDAKYAELGRKLPALIASAQASNAHDIAARAHVLLAQLALKGYQGMAWVAAERARAHAEATGNPVVIGEAAHAMGITMRRSGDYQPAIDHLTGAAAGLGRRPEHLAMRGTLLLTASYSAAQAGWRGQALDLIGEAEETAQRREAAAQHLYIPGVFGLDQTRCFRISVHHALGEDDQALTHAAQIDPRRLPSAERRGRMCMDLAHVWQSLDEPEKAFSTLRVLAQYAPQEAVSPKVRAITTALLTCRPDMPGLRRFAQGTGTPV